MIEVLDVEIEEFHLRIGKNVKAIREAKGLSQIDLSLAIGHSSSALVAKAEIGAYNKHFNIEHLYRISKVLDVPLCDILAVDV